MTDSLPHWPDPTALCGLHVLSLESRRTAQMALLIQEAGGIAEVVATMREQRLDLSRPAADLAGALQMGRVGALLCPTVVGTRLLLRELQASQAQALGQLRTVPILAGHRGVAQILATAGLQAQVQADPRDWGEAERWLGQTLPEGGQAVCVQYGEGPPATSLRNLAGRNVGVEPLPAHRIAFPADPRPMANAIRHLILGGPQLVLVSSGTQMVHLLHYAERLQLHTELRSALRRLPVVSIGPACSEALADLGLQTAAEAAPHTMTALVQAAAALMHLRRTQDLAQAG
ncbi:uroporphyrinogen-III synthase [Deinococcus hohokamensis]|uniref:Uroporphyrinogen-III synthase n=1 Tax=Deinococcus hohokamensis TaxID=309883 RepID=A0ABV9I7B1_9DEIO